MKQTENFIRQRVRREIPVIADEIKREVAKRVCSKVLQGMVDVKEGVDFDFYLQHFLVNDIKEIIDEEIASYTKNPPKAKGRPVKIKGAI